MTMAPTAGTLLQGRYRIEGPAGRGGMGAVYRATDLRLAATVAIKHRLGAGAALGAAFEREARLLAALRHPVLPKVTDHFVEDDAQFLVMEYVAGDDLAALQARRHEPFPVAQALAWADDLLDTLAYLHGHAPPVLHRDIKPANLKLTAQGRIALLDFGLARRRAAAEPGLAGYTLTYASPEQVRDEESTGRSDLYALAATLYDLITETSPPDASRRLAAVEAGQPDPLRPADGLRRDVPPSVALTLHRALALNPADRPDDAEAMREALRFAADERPTLIAAVGAAPAANGRPALPIGNLPTWLAPLVGRQAEVAAIQAFLGEDGARLVTLTGPGGAGKTRLALAAASDLAPRFRDGAWFVDLAPVADPALVASTVAKALGVRERGAGATAEALCEHLRTREALLVLDNFEQVLKAAPLVADLLAAGPGGRVLATSREPLRLRGEHEFPVPPLPAADAVALFAARARAVKPDFALAADSEPTVAAIVARLDGLPLAIELVAARTRLLPPPAMLARLERRLQVATGGPRDQPERQQTLRRTLDWSHDLLSPDEQRLFARLGVFVGGRSLAAIEAVCNADGGFPDGVLDGVESLVGKSLLRQDEGADGEPRLTLLETIQEYAREKLEAGGEAAALRRAHLDYYLGLAEASLPALVGPEQARWMANLGAEHDNLRAALAWARDVGDAESWLRLAWALWRFWELGYHLREGRAWLEAALAADTGASPQLRARALNGVANLTYMQGDLEPAIAQLNQALALFRQAGDRLGTARALNDLANVVGERGDGVAASALYEESLAVSREIGAAWEEACALHNLGLVADLLEDFDKAAALFADALPRWQRLGDEVSRARSLDAAAQVARHRGDLQRALVLGEEGLALRRQAGDRYGVAVSLGNLGWTWLERGDGERAMAYFREALPLHLDAGHRRGLAYCLTGVAGMAVAAGHAAAAARLLGAADAFEHGDGAVRAPAHTRRTERITATVAEALAAADFAAATAAGRALSPEQAVAAALSPALAPAPAPVTALTPMSMPMPMPGTAGR
jgi:predicted ATPase